MKIAVVIFCRENSQRIPGHCCNISRFMLSKSTAWKITGQSFSDSYCILSLKSFERALDFNLM